MSPWSGGMVGTMESCLQFDFGNCIFAFRNVWYILNEIIFAHSQSSSYFPPLYHGESSTTRRATLRGLELIEGIKAEQAQTTPQERGRARPEMVILALLSPVRVLFGKFAGLSLLCWMFFWVWFQCFLMLCFFSRGEMRRCIDNRVVLRKNKSPLLEVDLSWLYKNY